MREAVDEMRKPNGINIFHELLVKKRSAEIPRPNAPKVGFIINSYLQLDDDAFNYISNIGLNPIIKPDKRYICDACKQVIGTNYHE